MASPFSVIGVIGLIFLVSGLSVVAFSGSAVTGTITVTGLTTVCSSTAGSPLCTSSWTVNLTGFACTAKVGEVCAVEFFVYEGSTTCGGFTCKSGYYEYDALAFSGAEGSSVPMSQSFAGEGAASTVSIFVEDSNGLQASAAVHEQFSISGAGWTLTVDKAVAEGANGATVDTCLTTPPQGSAYAETPGSTVSLTAADPCVVTVQEGVIKLSYTFPFAQWDVDGTKVSTSSAYSLTMNTNHEALAVYGQSSFVCVSQTCNPIKWYPPVNIYVTPFLGSNSITVSPTTQASMVSGGKTTFTFTVAAGYTFSGWEVFPTGPNNLPGTPDTVKGTGLTAALTFAELVPFANVTGCVDCLSTTGSANLDSYASFQLESGTPTTPVQELPVLYISSSPGGTTNPVGGSYPEQPSASVTVTETPSVGYCFDFWSLNGANGGNKSSVTVTMGAYGTQKDVDPSFSQLINGVCNPSSQPTLTIGAATGVTFTPAVGYYLETYGKVVTVSYTLQSGYTFCDWSVDGNFAGTQNPITVTMHNGANYVSAFTMPSIDGCNGSGGGGGGGGGGGSQSINWTGVGLTCVGGLLVGWDVTKKPLGKRARVKFG